MTMPSQEAQRSRQTAMEAERHWWVERLRALIESQGDDWLMLGQPLATQILDSLDALIAERTK